jgi:outer membrane protein assembly factor BamA
VAGFGGDAKFIRGQVDADVFIPLFKQFLVAAVNVSIGAVKPIGGETTVSLSDRLFEQVRGYKVVGAFDPDTLEQHGGNLKAAATARLIFRSAPVERFLNNLSSPVKMHIHAFANAGNVAKVDFDQDYKKTAQEFMEGLQASYGIGFVLGLFFGRFEFNYSIPIDIRGITTAQKKHFSNFGMHFVYNF